MVVTSAITLAIREVIRAKELLLSVQVRRDARAGTVAIGRVLIG